MAEVTRWFNREYASNVLGFKREDPVRVGWYDTRTSGWLKSCPEVRLWWNGEVWLAGPDSPTWSTFHDRREWRGQVSRR